MMVAAAFLNSLDAVIVRLCDRAASRFFRSKKGKPCYIGHSIKLRVEPAIHEKQEPSWRDTRAHSVCRAVDSAPPRAGSIHHP
ncbi:hypothetical protein ACCT04_34840, partial [Rhizobium ruizarguesonis]